MDIPQLNCLRLIARNGTTYIYQQKNSRLGKGGFGDARSGIKIENNESIEVAMKFEKLTRGTTASVYNEKMIYKILGEHSSIPKYYDCLNDKRGSVVLIIELLGPSLDIILKPRKRFSIKTTMMIGLQILDIMEYVHSKGVLFNDVKPHNFAVGKTEETRIFILDFGLSKLYKRNGQHIQLKRGGTGPGTGKYLSLYAHTNFILSRRDDIESIAYMLVEFLNGGLWGGSQDPNEIYRRKLYIKRVVGKGKCSKMFSTFLTYVRKLGFKQTPNYTYLRNLLLDVLTRNGFENDLQFDWIRKKYVEKEKQFELHGTQEKSIGKQETPRKLIYPPNSFSPQNVQSTAITIFPNTQTHPIVANLPIKLHTISPITLVVPKYDGFTPNIQNQKVSALTAPTVIRNIAVY